MRLLPLLLIAISVLLPKIAAASTVEYTLTIENRTVKKANQEVDFALSVNGSIPAPTLKFIEGDEALIHVVNKTNEDTSIHWHGILLPNEMDGVSFLTTPPIKPGQKHTFQFTIRQSGTYWYHSHTNLQEQRGVYGAIVIHPKEERNYYDKEEVIVLSDWIDEDPKQVLKNLKKDGHYYAMKKGSMGSWVDAFRKHSIKDYFLSQLVRMGMMDLSDVGYDAYLLNGKQEYPSISAKKGEVIRLRLVNASASTYFYVNLGRQKFKIISADGIDVEPLEVDELLIATAETYDILFSVPDEKSYEFRATAHDVTGHASTFIGQGDKEMAPEKRRPNLYKAMEQLMNPSPSFYTSLKSVEKTSFPDGKPRYEFRLELNGDMDRYVWTLNGTLLTEDRNIFINEGDIVTFVLENKTMMHHPVHLHGHFFRVINGQDDFAPLKHTMDVAPLKTEVIEFYAIEPGQWFFHCHNLYHMKSGMSKIVNYKSFNRSPALIEAEKDMSPFYIMDKDWYFHGKAEVYTSDIELYLRYSNARWQIDSKSEMGEYNRHHFESDLFGRRWLTRNFNVLAGWDHHDEEGFGVVGLSYRLPLFIEATPIINDDGDLRLDIEKEIHITSRIKNENELEFREGETDWAVSFLYSFNWALSAGFRFGDEGFGVGGKFRF